MGNYYFVGTLLPDLHIDEKPEIGFAEFDRLLYDNLSVGDYKKAIVFRAYYDILNIRSYWKGEAFDPAGNLDPVAMEEALITRSVFPSYVFEFIDKYENNEERIRHFPLLLATFFHNEILQARGIFKRFLVMERELRLILVAFRAKLLGRDVVKELQYEDPEDELVAQIIAQKDAAEYEPPEKYAETQALFKRYHDDPMAFQKAYYNYRFQKINEMINIDSFSMDRLLAYMVKLIIVEKWLRLSKQKGLEIVDSMLKEPL